MRAYAALPQTLRERHPLAVVWTLRGDARAFGGRRDDDDAWWRHLGQFRRIFLLAAFGGAISECGRIGRANGRGRIRRRAICALDRRNRNAAFRRPCQFLGGLPQRISANSATLRYLFLIPSH